MLIDCFGLRAANYDLGLNSNLEFCRNLSDALTLSVSSNRCPNTSVDNLNAAEDQNTNAQYLDKIISRVKKNRPGSKVMQQICLDCGMRVSETTRNCPKCDNPLNLQHDGSTITVDIAHQGERVSEALQKMQSEIDLASKGVAKSIRLVVGSGLIRDEVVLVLRDLKFRGDVIDFEAEPFNAGAILVRLK